MEMNLILIGQSEISEVDIDAIPGIAAVSSVSSIRRWPTVEIGRAALSLVIRRGTETTWTCCSERVIRSLV